MLRRSVLVATAFLVACGGVSKADMAAMKQRADRAVRSEMAAAYGGVTTDFTVPLKARFPIAYLVELHDAMIGDYGAVQRIEPSVVPIRDKREASVVIDFPGDHQVTALVSFDGHDLIKKLFFARSTRPNLRAVSACPLQKR